MARGAGGRGGGRHHHTTNGSYDDPTVQGSPRPDRWPAGWVCIRSKDSLHVSENHFDIFPPLRKLKWCSWGGFSTPPLMMLGTCMNRRLFFHLHMWMHMWMDGRRTNRSNRHKTHRPSKRRKKKRKESQCRPLWWSDTRFMVSCYCATRDTFG